MQEIILKKSKVLHKPNHVKLFKGEQNADYIKFFTPTTYEDTDLSDCNIRLNYVLSDGSEDSFLIDEYKQTDLSDNQIVYLIPIDSTFTSVSGKIEISLIITKTEDKSVILKSTSTYIYIDEQPSGTNEPTEEDLNVIDQVVLISNEALNIAKSKQDKLTQGENITIDENGVISASGGVDNYNDFEDKPSVNGYILEGNKTSEELGLQPKGDYAILKEIQGYQNQEIIDLGTISQGGFGDSNNNVASAQVCKTELLEVNLNGEVIISSLPSNIKYRLYYGDSSSYSETNKLNSLTTDYVSDNSFNVVAKYIRVKFVAYDDNGNRTNITPDMCEGIKFTTTQFKAVKTQNKKNKTIRVAASTATNEEKAYADYLCDGVNDEVEINEALNELAEMNGGKLLLSSGKFIIDNFNLDSDGVYRAISVPAITGLTITIQGMGGMTDGDIVGTCIDLSNNAYANLPTTTTEQRELFGQAFTATSSSTVLYLKDIRFRSPDNQKPLIFIDLYNFGRATLEHVYGYAYIGKLGANLTPAIEGLVGVRMLRGSNFGSENTYKSCGMNGFYEAWQVGSEHVLMTQCSAIYNVYGYTFGNYEWTNAFLHPITMIRCTDERNINMPLFKACGFYNSSANKGQRINMIDFSIERKEDGTPGRTLGTLAIEETPGTFNGDIVFTLMNANNINSVDVPFFESGGDNFKVRNSLHKLSGNTALRESYAPNNNEEFFDTDENKLYKYMNGEWVAVSVTTDEVKQAITLTEDSENIIDITLESNNFDGTNNILANNEILITPVLEVEVGKPIIFKMPYGWKNMIAYKDSLKFSSTNLWSYVDINWGVINIYIPTQKYMRVKFSYWVDDVKQTSTPEDLIDRLKVYTETIASLSHWNGKNWYAYGTSMTDTSIGTGKYAPFLQEFSQMQLTNKGIGGGGIVVNTQIKDAIMNITDGKTDADLITFEVGLNDTSVAELGTIYDTGDTTFCGALNQCIRYLQENTKAQIVVMSMTKSRTTVGGEPRPLETTFGNDNHTWQDLVDRIREVCRLNGVPFIDVSGECGLGYARMSDAYQVDQTHWTEAMGYIGAKFIWHKLKQIPPFI